jgi:hypothetical protein
LGGDAEDKGVTAAVAIELSGSIRIVGNCQLAGNKERPLISR